MRCHALLLSSLLLGCGTRSGLGSEESRGGEFVVDSGAAIEDIGSVVDSGSEREDIGPNSPDCPASLPVVTESCRAGLVCDYAGCDPARKDRARCSDGHWKIEVAACSGGGPGSRCPVDAPTEGTPCMVPHAVACEYSRGCLANTSAACDEEKKVWTIQELPCTAHSSDCPPTFPADGSECRAPKPGEPDRSCLYTNQCGLTEFTECVDGKWVGSPTPCSTVAPCPAIEPKPGDKCSKRSPVTCVWNNGCGTLDEGYCDGKVWQVHLRACATP